MKVLKVLQQGLLATALVSLGGCSLFEDEELTYKELQPFNATVNPSAQWDVSVGDGVENFFSRLNPAVVGDVIVAADRDGYVAAYSRSDGKRVWERDLQAEYAAQGASWLDGTESLRISGGVTGYAGKALLASENGDVFMLDAATGEVNWHAKVNAEIVADPAFDGSYVVVAAGNGQIFAFDAENGEEIWNLPTDVPALTLRGNSKPTLAAGGAIIGTATGKLTVVVLQNGQQAWEARLAVPKGATELQRLVDVDSAPIVSGPTIYNIAYNGQLAAVEIRTGRIVWQREYSSFQNLAMYGSNLYLTDTQDHVYSINTDGGIERWVNNDFEGRELTAPVYFQGYIVVGDDFGYLHFIDAQTGKTSGRLELDDAAYSQPVVEDDQLFIQTRDGTLLAVRIN